MQAAGASAPARPLHSYITSQSGAYRLPRVACSSPALQHNERKWARSSAASCLPGSSHRPDAATQQARVKNGSDTSSSGPDAGSAAGAPLPAGAYDGSYSQHYKAQVGVRAASADSSPSNSAPDGTSGASGAAGDGSTASSSANGSASVEAALRQAQAALRSAETELAAMKFEDDGATPAMPNMRLETLLGAVKALVGLGVLGTGMVASHAFGLACQLGAAVVGAIAIAGWGYARRSLSRSGAIAALFVGAGSLACSLRCGAVLIAFFLSSSKLTQFKEELKEGLEENAKKGGQRDWKQVFCNAFVPTVLAVAYGVVSGCVDVPLGGSPHLDPAKARLLTALMGGFVGYYACCCGDTWASELGTLSSETPRLITTGRPVRRGTNGGITRLGLTASVAGGLFIGAVAYAAALVSPTLWILPAQQAAAAAQWRLLPLGLLAGLAGSVVDSLLGATLQFSGYNTASQRIVSRPGPDVVPIAGLPFLTNNTVNLLSASLTAAGTAVAAVKLFA